MINMSIEAIVLIIGLMICSYGLGYYIGQRNCFEYLKAEMEKMKENKK